MLIYGAVRFFISAGASLHNISFGVNNHTESENDTGIIFQNSSEEDFSHDPVSAYEGRVRWGSGPKIQEIASNNSSLASLPQNFTSSPPKTVGVFQRNKSHNDMLEYQNKTFNFKRDVMVNIAEVPKKGRTAVESQSFSTLSEVSGHFGRVKTEPVVKFSLDTSTLDSNVQFELENESINGQGDFRKRPRVYKRSISCDPVASGEMALAVEDGSRFQFIETEFPLQVIILVCFCVFKILKSTFL